ncbi:3,4-dihydroxy-2-butanone-4-phosphate synthase [Aquipuribacter sp. SD81]|uniref:3,4-dihydroxy-2-butanone-4-phosphate synthase n=1 Tax=Aquipuribacter sp. SD81 TaxID=3127703 RepID=UPI00301A5304
MSAGLATVEAALAELRAGRPVVVVDDADRENEGDVVMAAATATPRWVGWTVRHSSGYICAPMPAETADRLELPLMVGDSEDPLRTAYTVSVDAREGVTTGISAGDRARTLRLLADPTTVPHDLVRPGHVLPLRARPGGVLERNGHTEAAVDLCRAAGLPPVGMICELVDDDGELLRLPQLLALARTEGLLVVSIADLVAWRRAREAAGLPPVVDASPAGDAVVPAQARVRHVASADLPARTGTFRVHAYHDVLTGAEHLAIAAAGPSGPAGPGDTPGRRAVLVRVHSECLSGDALGSLRCDCGPQLEAALARVALEGGVVVYVRGHEGRGIGLAAKVAAYALQDAGLDTVDANTVQGLPADAREYGAATAVLADLGVDRVRLLTNNNDKVAALEAGGVEVVERVPLVVGTGPDNVGYLAVKRDRMGHVLPGTLDGTTGTTSRTSTTPAGRTGRDDADGRTA